jgi:cyclopropane fatty-acyl-phospholipid synthase-like methyltransferase
MTIYKTNPQEYIDQTIKINMTHVYSVFEKYLKPSSYIWDVGCGSGRDSIFFSNKGHTLLASDYSQEMIDLIRPKVNFKIIVDDMTNSQINDQFDAIWACSSLLHLKKDHLSNFFKHISNNLKPNGMVYCSFKKGEVEREKFCLIFQDFTIDSFAKYMKELNMFDVIESFETKDSLSELRPDWVNFVLKKKN